MSLIMTLLGTCPPAIPVCVWNVRGLCSFVGDVFGRGDSLGLNL